MSSDLKTNRPHVRLSELSETGSKPLESGDEIQEILDEVLENILIDDPDPAQEPEPVEILEEPPREEGLGRYREPVYLNLERDYHDRQFQMGRVAFHNHLKERVRVQIQMELVMGPGLSGEPVLNSMPVVFWRDAADVHQKTARELADSILPELYHNVLRSSLFNCSESELDEQILIALINFALWQGRDHWILNLAFLAAESHADLKVVYNVAAVVAMQQGLVGVGEYFIHLAGEVSPYGLSCYRILHNRNYEGADIFPRDAKDYDGLELLRLALLKAALESDYLLENKLLRRYEAEVHSLDQLLSFYCFLVNRGRNYQALRLLFRRLAQHQVLTSLIRHMYLQNGKYRAYLATLKRGSALLEQNVWYEINYCFHRLGRRGVEMREYIRALPNLAQPPRAEQRRFLKHLEALGQNRFQTESLSSRYGDTLALGLYFAQQQENIDSRQESRDYVAQISKIFFPRLKDVAGLLNYETIFRYVFWGLLFIQDRALLEHIIHYLEAMSGRNEVLRIILGFYYYDKGDIVQSAMYLRRAPAHPLALHRLADIHNRNGDTVEAERIYAQLLKKSRTEPILWVNYGIILEENGRPLEALRAFQKALELEPELQIAKQRSNALHRYA